jgi:DNA polymerase-3 subunit gamma/tau
MGQALYRKYRSKSLDEIVGQDHITKTLSNAIDKGRISHAYLFTGPRGVGKTSIARILAHQLNNVPYDGEGSHLDIVEIDAASTGGVDEIRDLREKVYIAPVNGKYRVYIIDEVHMMSPAAFNALLKTLEEPPAHVIFILATTEAHKLPATIISRTQRYTFRPISADKMVKHLRYIADQEKIVITDDALKLIADHSDGSFRDSIGMLDQASSVHSKIGRNELETLLGIPSDSAIQEIITKLKQNNAHDLITLLASLEDSGYQAAVISKRLGQQLRTSLVDNQLLLDKHQTLAILTKLIEVPASHNPEQLLELILLDATLDVNTQIIVTDSDKPDVTLKNDHKVVSTKKFFMSPKSQPSSAKLDIPATTNSTHEMSNKNPAVLDSVTINEKQWQTTLESLKKQSNTLYGVIKLGRAEFLPGKVTLTFNHAFHQKQANNAKNKALLARLLLDITEHVIEIECIYDENALPPFNTSDHSDRTADSLGSLLSPLETISNIFGGAELLES